MTVEKVIGKWKRTFIINKKFAVRGFLIVSRTFKASGRQFKAFERLSGSINFLLIIQNGWRA